MSSSKITIQYPQKETIWRREVTDLLGLNRIDLLRLASTLLLVALVPFVLKLSNAPYITPYFNALVYFSLIYGVHEFARLWWLIRKFERQSQTHLEQSTHSSIKLADPITKVDGIGKKFGDHLSDKYGLKTVRDLGGASPDTITSIATANNRITKSMLEKWLAQIPS